MTSRPVAHSFMQECEKKKNLDDVEAFGALVLVGVLAVPLVKCEAAV